MLLGIRKTFCIDYEAVAKVIKQKLATTNISACFSRVKQAFMRNQSMDYLF